MNAFNNPRPHWFIRYKLYHIPFWLVYHYLWWATTIGNPVKAATSILSTPFAIKYLFYVVFQALAVYFNLYFLIPRYLEKSRFTEYIPYLILPGACLLALAWSLGFFRRHTPRRADALALLGMALLLYLTVGAEHACWNYCF